jgi:hypothetical protein
VADRFMNAVKDDYQAMVDNYDQKEEARVKKFQDAVKRQLVKLVGYMNRLGTKRVDGRLSVSFGELFDAVQNDMATLSGTLKTAKRMGVVTWEGPETLFQTADDAVEIVLLQSDQNADFQPLVHEKVNFSSSSSFHIFFCFLFCIYRAMEKFKKFAIRSN